MNKKKTENAKTSQRDEDKNVYITLIRPKKRRRRRRRNMSNQRMKREDEQVWNEHTHTRRSVSLARTSLYRTMSVLSRARDTLSPGLRQAEKGVLAAEIMHSRKAMFILYGTHRRDRYSSVSIGYQSSMTLRRHVGHESFSYAREAVSIG